MFGGGFFGQRCKADFAAFLLAQNQGFKRLRRQLSGQVNHPVPHQVGVAEFFAVTAAGEQAGTGDNQPAGFTFMVAAQVIDQVQHLHGPGAVGQTVFKWQRFVDRLGPFGQSALIPLEQIRQAAGEVTAQPVFGYTHTQVAAPRHAIQSAFQAFVQVFFITGFQ